MVKTKDIKKQLLQSPKKPAEPSASDRVLLSTGSTLLDLNCSGRIAGGIPAGTLLHFVGDSDSGKSFFGMTMFAEAARNKAFDDYRLIFSNPEDGALMDWAKYFGKKAAKRIEEQKPEDLEQFYYNMDDAIADERPFVCVLDSMDALYPRAWLKKFKAAKRAAKKGEQEAGDFGTQKAKINSEHLRRLRTALRRKRSILVILSQTRDNVGARFGDKKTVSGGHVLKFFSTLQLWSSTRDTTYKSVMGQQRPIGIRSLIRIKKNHLIGRKGSVLVPILNDSGIDDVGSCVDYLVEEGHWKSTGKEGKGKITAPEFTDKAVGREKLIRMIEADDGERQLKILVKRIWTEILEGCKSNRKRRYE